MCGASGAATSGRSCGSSRIASGKVATTRSYIAAERSGVLDLHAVLALEVDDVDRAGGGEVLADGERPGRRGVELEVDVGVVGEAAVDRVGRRRVAEARAS